MFVAALYQPPAPIYSQDDLFDYIEACVDELSRDFPAAPTVLAGDLNQLSDEDLVERMGLMQIVHQPTRGGNILNRVLISDPQLYTTVRVVASIIKSNHKAVVVYADKSQCARLKKTTFQRTHRPKTPTQHAMFLQHIAAVTGVGLGLGLLSRVDAPYTHIYPHHIPTPCRVRNMVSIRLKDGFSFECSGFSVSIIRNCFLRATLQLCVNSRGP